MHDSWVLSIFIPDNSFGEVLNISPTTILSYLHRNIEVSYVEVWCTNRNSISLEIEDRIILTLVINDRGI